MIAAFDASEQLALAAGQNWFASMDRNERAEAHMIVREYAIARQILVDGITVSREKNPIDVTLRLQHTLAKLHLELGQNDAALNLMRDVLLCADHITGPYDQVEMNFTLVSALIRTGDVAEAARTLTAATENLPAKWITMRVHAELLWAEMRNGDEREKHLNRARAFAFNDGSYHLVNVCDITVALDWARGGRFDKAETLLRRALESAEKYDDQALIYEARVRLAAVLIEVARAGEALDLLRTMSTFCFGDDEKAAWRFTSVLASALVEQGELDDARAVVTPILDLPYTEDNFALLAEAHWILSLIVREREGRSPAWMNHLGKSVAHSLKAFEGDLANERVEEFLADDRDRAVTPLLQQSEA